MPLHIIPFEDYYLKEQTFLTCISYEDRSILVLKKILDCKKTKKCVLIKLTDLILEKKEKFSFYSQLKDEDKKVIDAWNKNYTDTLEILRQNGIETIEIEGSSCDPVSLAKKIKNGLPNDEKVLFDISSTPKHVLLEIFRWNQEKKFICLYARPGVDREAEPEFSIGTKTIGVLRGFEGNIRIERSNLLILFLGFEGSRALNIFKQLEPYGVIAFLGNTFPFFSKEKNTFFIENAKRNNSQLLSNQRVICNEISSLDPYSVVEQLDSTILEYSKNNKTNILVSCLGTKPQTLGLFLYWLKNKDIQIIYSLPSKRRISSVGLGSIWIYKLKELLHE